MIPATTRGRPPVRARYGRGASAVGEQAWVEGRVDSRREHIGIYPGEARRPVALIAHTPPRHFTVQFLVDARSSRRTEQILQQVRSELSYYLLHAVGPDSWSFAKYHCESPANAASLLHWRWSAGESAKSGGSA